MSLEKLTNAFGLIILFEGLACLAGVPVASWLKAVIGLDEVPFLYAGVVIIISALLLVPMLWVQRKELARAEKKKLKAEGVKA